MGSLAIAISYYCLFIVAVAIALLALTAYLLYKTDWSSGTGSDSKP
ncbi:hypothetical protein [Pleurocapsa sp. CCALA 161]|nr:hypothetical protein [Pleurocapsa sp. CCALA 161]